MGGMEEDDQADEVRGRGLDFGGLASGDETEGEEVPEQPAEVERVEGVEVPAVAAVVATAPSTTHAPSTTDAPSTTHAPSTTDDAGTPNPRWAETAEKARRANLKEEQEGAMLHLQQARETVQVASAAVDVACGAWEVQLRVVNSAMRAEARAREAVRVAGKAAGGLAGEWRAKRVAGATSARPEAEAHTVATKQWAQSTRKREMEQGKLTGETHGRQAARKALKKAKGELERATARHELASSKATDAARPLSSARPRPVAPAPAPAAAPHPAVPHHHTAAVRQVKRPVLLPGTLPNHPPLPTPSVLAPTAGKGVARVVGGGFGMIGFAPLGPGQASGVMGSNGELLHGDETVYWVSGPL